MFLVGILVIYFLVNQNSSELFQDMPNLNTTQNNIVPTIPNINNNTIPNTNLNVNNTTNEEIVDAQELLKNEILETDTVPLASSNAVETGSCYRPETDTSSSTSELDTSLVNQMSQVDDAQEYLHIVNTMRQKYKNKLSDTINLLNNTQNDINTSLNNVKQEFNEYGMEMLSKQYYDTIYKHGSFE
jgi:hypothetical protein